VTKLTEEQINERLENEVPEWSLVGEAITRTYQFAHFAQSIEFVNKVAAEAEEAQHHPDILVRFNKVSLTLATHDAGGITGKDFDLAARTDDLAAEVRNEG